MSGDAFLAGAHQMNSQEPFVKRYMAILKDGLDCDRELLTASGTLPESLARLTDSLACGLDFLKGLFLRGNLVGFAHQTTVRADNAVRPAHLLKVLSGLIFICEMGF